MGHIKLFLQVWDGAILKLRHFSQVSGAPRRFKIQFCLLETLLNLLGPMKRCFFCTPDAVEILKFCFHLLNVRIKLFKSLPGPLVFLVLERFTFNLELDQSSFQTIHLLWFGIHFHADQTCSLINQINRFVGKLPVGNISVGKLGRGDDCWVCNIYAVMNLIPFF